MYYGNPVFLSSKLVRKLKSLLKSLRSRIALPKKSWLKCSILKNLLTAGNVYKLTKRLEKERAFNAILCRKAKTGFTLSKDRYSRRSCKRMFRVFQQLKSSIKRKIRHFHIAVVQWRQRNVHKSLCTWPANLLFCSNKPVVQFFFLTFSLLSPSSLLKVPIILAS